MATFQGRDGLVKVGTDQVAEVDNWSIDSSAATEEDTAQGDVWQTFKSGLRTWTGTIECHWDDTDTNGQEALTIGAEVTLNLYPEGDTTGQYEYTGLALVTGISVGSSKDAVTSRQFTFQGNGALTIGTAT